MSSLEPRMHRGWRSLDLDRRQLPIHDDRDPDHQSGVHPRTDLAHRLAASAKGHFSSLVEPAMAALSCQSTSDHGMARAAIEMQHSISKMGDRRRYGLHPL